MADQMTVLSELETAVAALALGPEHSVLVESCRRLAAVVDGAVRCEECGREAFDDKLWREWRLLLGKLLEVGDGGDVGQSFDAMIAELRGETGPVGVGLVHSGHGISYHRAKDGRPACGAAGSGWRVVDVDLGSVHLCARTGCFGGDHAAS